MDIAIYIVVGGLFLAFSMWQRVQTQEQWEGTANELGLQFESGLLSGPKITGRYNGAPVEIMTVTRGGKNNRKTYTVFDVGLPPQAPPDLVVAEEGFFSGIGKFVGMQDIEIGDLIFDQQFVIKGKNPTRVKNFLLQDRVADEIFEVYGSYPNTFEIKNGHISFESLGRATGYDIELALDTVSKCISAMRGQPTLETDGEPRSARSGPFGGIPEHVKNSPGPARPTEPPPSGNNGKFGPPTQDAGTSAPTHADQGKDTATQNPPDNQPDDWW
ncbi:MAG: hypothetical protein ACQEVA_04475 [Myxococcota bacterium]